MTVYVVFREYNDNRCSWPSAVFSSHAKAQIYISMQDKDDGGTWEIDSYVIDIDVYD